MLVHTYIVISIRAMKRFTCITILKNTYPVFTQCSIIAATSMGTCMILSSWATRSIEDVAQASSSGLRWFQLYVYRDKSITANLVQRATQAGYKALVITIDTPILGRRLADCRNGFNLLGHLKLVN